VKKILVIAILICYSVASFGVSLNYFYCCGKLKTVSLAPQKSAGENCKSKSKGCCKNKTVTIQLKVDQKETDQFVYHFDKLLSFIPHFSSGNSQLFNLTECYKLSQLYKKPPPSSFPSRDILFCIFRI
jgi:hypothetical protein